MSRGLTSGQEPARDEKPEKNPGRPSFGVRSARRPLHAQIADDLRAAIARGDYPLGTQMPPESVLVERYDAARGTVRVALQALTAEGLLGSRRGTPRVVLDTSVTQSFSQLRSFAQWAHSVGRSPGGRFVQREVRVSEPAEAQALQIPPGEEVVHTLRVRTLDGEPVFTERSAYPRWTAEAIMSLDDDCPSMTVALEDLIGLRLASGTHTIDLGEADDLDAELLSVPVGEALLRRRGVTRRADGTPCEYTEDRFLRGTVSFTFHNSVDNNPLTRRVTT